MVNKRNQRERADLRHDDGMITLPPHDFDADKTGCRPENEWMPR